MKKIFACAAAGAIVLGCTACSYIPALTGLETEESEIELPVGQTKTVTYTTLTEADAEDFQPPVFHSVAEPELTVGFESENPAVISVDEAGCIRGLAPGEAAVVITAADGTVSFEREIQVTCFQYIETFEKLPGMLELEAGTVHDLMEGFGNYDRWNALTVSSDESVAACDGAVIKAAGPGKAAVTLQSDSDTKEIQVTCFQYIESLEPVPETLEIDVDTVYDIMDSFGSYDRWNALAVSSDENVVRCDDSSIRAVGPGDAVIAVTLGEKTKEIAFHSRQAVKEFRLNHEALSGTEGTAASVAMESWLPEDANDGFELTYTSSDEEIASVDDDGTVHLIAPGEAVISAVNSFGVKAECSVTVTKKAAAQPKENKGSTDPKSYDSSIPAVKAVLSMIGGKHRCTEVAEAAANTKGVSAWTTSYLGNGVRYMLLTPEGFLSVGKKVPYSQAQPGDILYYAEGGLGMSHVAVYIGNGMAVHGNYGSDRLTKIASATFVEPTYVIHID